MEGKLTRRALIQDFMVIALAIACTASGYYWGKHAADRYYANALCFHGSTNGVPVAATPQIITGIEEHDIRPLPHAPVILYALDARTCEWGYVDDQREGHLYEGPCEPNKVKLIPPIKVRTAAPVAKIEKPPKTIIVPQCLELVPIGAASVEEPR